MKIKILFTALFLFSLQDLYSTDINDCNDDSHIETQNLKTLVNRNHTDEHRTLTQAIIKIQGDIIEEWKNIHYPKWIEDMNTTQRLNITKSFGTYCLDPTIKIIRSAVAKVIEDELQIGDMIPFYHACSPKFGYLYMVQSILDNLINDKHNNSMWNFRLLNEGKKFTNINELINECNSSSEKDESGDFRNNALCTVPSILTNFLYSKESAAQLWFESESVNNQQASASSHTFILEKIISSYGFEKQAFFDFRNDLLKVLKEDYPQSGRLFRILINPEIVNDIVYLSSTFGRPCSFTLDGQPINDVNLILQAYTFEKNIKGTFDIYDQTHPINIGNIQARILFKKEYFSNPHFIKIDDYFINENDRNLIMICEQKLKNIINKHFTNKGMCN